VGKQAIILVIAFLVIVGYIFVHINTQQQKAVQDLNASAYAKQVRLLSNSLLEARCKELREELDGGLPFTEHKVYTNIENIAWSTGEAWVYTDEYNGYPLLPDQYYIVCTAQVTATDGIMYKTGTNVLYNHPSSSQELAGWEELPLEVITP